LNKTTPLGCVYQPFSSKETTLGKVLLLISSKLRETGYWENLRIINSPNIFNYGTNNSETLSNPAANGT
jgi:hypothetical protein